MLLQVHHHTTQSTHTMIYRIHYPLFLVLMLFIWPAVSRDPGFYKVTLNNILTEAYIICQDMQPGNLVKSIKVGTGETPPEETTLWAEVFPDSTVIFSDIHQDTFISLREVPGTGVKLIWSPSPFVWTVEGEKDDQQFIGAISRSSELVFWGSSQWNLNFIGLQRKNDDLRIVSWKTTFEKVVRDSAK